MYVGAITAPPGDYTLRLAVVDGQGQFGSIDRPVRARVTPADPLRLGDLIVTERQSGELVPPAIPRVGRDGLTAFLEVYGQSEADLDAAQIAIDLAESADAPPIVSGAASLTSHDQPGRRVAIASLGATLVPPGRHVARARAMVNGRTVGSVTRAFELVGEPAAAPEPPSSPEPSASTGARAPAIDVSNMVWGSRPRT